MPDTPSPAALLVVADVRLLRDALANTLSTYPEFSLLGTADSSERVLDMLRMTELDIVVFDASMSGVLQLVRPCAETHPALRFVAVAVTESEQGVMACAEAGVAGYVPRDGSVDELVRTLAHVRRGELLCSPRVAGSLFRRVAALAAERVLVEESPVGTLTHREGEIVELLERGLSNKEIARHLGIEIATAKNHVHHILEKLRVSRRGEAAARLRSKI
jgi:two-component system nitrate/nitrite response regulator NarL